MPRSATDVPYLRLVDATQPDAIEPLASDAAELFLCLIDMSEVSDVGLEALLSRLQPAWLFDLRPVPYFDIGRLNRKRMFALFRKWGISYRDVAGALQISERNDASLNSGAVSAFMNEAIAKAGAASSGSVAVLLDDREPLEHAMKILPRFLRGAAAGPLCTVSLDMQASDGCGGLVLLTDSGERRVLCAPAVE